MILPVQITFRNMTPSEAVAARVQAEAEKLDRSFKRITSCRVVVEAMHRHHKWGEQFHVPREITASAPHGKSVAGPGRLSDPQT